MRDPQYCRFFYDKKDLLAHRQTQLFGFQFFFPQFIHAWAFTLSVLDCLVSFGHRRSDQHEGGKATSEWQ